LSSNPYGKVLIIIYNDLLFNINSNNVKPRLYETSMNIVTPRSMIIASSLKLDFFFQTISPLGIIQTSLASALIYRNSTALGKVQTSLPLLLLIEKAPYDTFENNSFNHMKTITHFFVFFVLVFFVSCQSGYEDDINLGEWYSGEIPEAYNEKYKDYEENPFLKVSEFPKSTFSIDADGASYANMRRFVYLGQKPPKASVRTEEYINYFTYNYPEPESGENVSLSSDIVACPWDEEHHILRLGMKGKTIPEDQLPNSNYVFLIDVSGSMNSPDKLGILKTGFKQFVDELDPKDRIAIVVYAGQVGVLLPSTNASEKQKIKNAIDKLGAGGSTAGAAGITTAYEIAQENFIKDGNNRIILGTDGDFNVGISSTDDLVELIEEKRKSGIYLTVLGVGGGNLNDP